VRYEYATSTNFRKWDRERMRLFILNNGEVKIKVCESGGLFDECDK